jgi:hypothetical protein
MRKTSIVLGNPNKEGCDFLKFLMIPDEEEERRCYEAYYDAMATEVLALAICPVCGHENFKKEGEESWLLNDLSMMEILTTNAID